MGVLEWGLAAQAKHAEGSMSEVRLQRDAFVAATITYQSKQLEDTMERMENLEGVPELKLVKALVTGEQLRQVEGRMGELEEWAGEQLQQAKGGIAKRDADAVLMRRGCTRGSVRQESGCSRWQHASQSSRQAWRSSRDKVLKESTKTLLEKEQSSRGGYVYATYKGDPTYA